MSHVALRSACRGASLLLFASLGATAEPGAVCWKGELEVSTSNFSGSDGRVVFSKLVYDIYQSKSGVVRRELKYSHPPLRGVIGIGRDVHLIDYARGTLVVFDKDKREALRYRSLDGLERDPLAGPHERLEAMRILGHRCQGAMNRSESGGLAELRESWAATEAGFRHPFLDIARAIASPEAARRLGVQEGLLSMTVRTITHLERVEGLDDSLFRVPAGYEVVDVAPHGTGH